MSTARSMPKPFQHGQAQILPGQLFNPKGVFTAFPVPVTLLSSKHISDSAKLLFGRLIMHYGDDGQCNPRIGTLARELQVSDRKINRLISELARGGLVTVTRTGRSSHYGFCWHPLLTGSIRPQVTVRPIEIVASDATRSSYQKRQFGSDSRPDLSERDARNLSDRNKEEANKQEAIFEAASRVSNDVDQVGTTKEQASVARLDPEDRVKVANLSNAILRGDLVAPESDLVTRMWISAVERGARSVEDLLGFMDHQARMHARNRWNGPGIWIVLIRDHFAAFVQCSRRVVLIDSPRTMECQKCVDSGVVDPYTSPPTFCECKAGQRLSDIWDSGDWDAGCTGNGGGQRC